MSDQNKLKGLRKPETLFISAGGRPPLLQSVGKSISSQWRVTFCQTRPSIGNTKQMTPPMAAKRTV